MSEDKNKVIAAAPTRCCGNCYAFIASDMSFGKQGACHLNPPAGQALVTGHSAAGPNVQMVSVWPPVKSDTVCMQHRFVKAEEGCPGDA